MLLEETLKQYIPPNTAARSAAGLRPRKVPDQYDLEEKIGTYLEEQFETLVEDGSVEEVCELVCLVFFHPPTLDRGRKGGWNELLHACG